MAVDVMSVHMKRGEEEYLFSKSETNREMETESRGRKEGRENQEVICENALFGHMSETLLFRSIPWFEPDTEHHER